MSALYNLVAYQRWQAAITNIQSIADGDAADQVFYRSQYGDTAVMYACHTWRHWNSLSR